MLWLAVWYVLWIFDKHLESLDLAKKGGFSLFLCNYMAHDIGWFLSGRMKSLTAGAY